MGSPSAVAARATSPAWSAAGRSGRAGCRPRVAGLRGVLDRELDAAHRVLEQDQRVGGLGVTVDRDLPEPERLRAEAVDGRAEGGVVVEAGDEPRVDPGLVRVHAVDRALAQDRDPEVPRPCREQGVVGVVPLAEVVECLGPLREGHGLAAPRWTRSKSPSSMSMSGRPSPPSCPASRGVRAVPARRPPRARAATRTGSSRRSSPPCRCPRPPSAHSAGRRGGRSRRDRTHRSHRPRTRACAGRRG